MHISEVTQAQLEAAKGDSADAFTEFLDQIQDLNEEEVLNLRGTEFLYKFSNGDSVHAVVVQCALWKGLTCKALSPFTIQHGSKIWEDWEVQDRPKDYDNLICYPDHVVQESSRNYLTNRCKMQRVMKTIMLYKEYTFTPIPRVSGMHSCTF